MDCHKRKVLVQFDAASRNCMREIGEKGDNGSTSGKNKEYDNRICFKARLQT